MNDQTDNAKCQECGASSDQTVLLACLSNNQQSWVCVHCLPMLIHGAH